MLESIIEKLKIYNKLELYKWLMVSVLHPSNQQFIIRYEFLLYVLLSIPEDNFSNNTLGRQKFDHLIEWFSKRYAKDFTMVEDWEPFDQRKLIPIFFEKKKYYFFYGASERPYESIRQFQEILFTKNIEALDDIKKEFLFSLAFQTRILEDFIKDKEAAITSENMFVPSIKFFKKYSNALKVKDVNLDYVHNSQSEYEMNQNNFNGLYVFVDGEYFILHPQCHIETLYQIGEERLYNNSDSNLLERINKGLNSRSQNMIMKFFGIRDMLEGLVDPILKENSANYFDSIARVDADKIVLFKYVPHSSSNLIDVLNQVAKEAFETLEAIKRNSYLGLQYINQKVEKSNLVPPEILNFTTIIIFEKLTLNYMLGFEKNWKEKDIHIFNSLDFRPILELLQEKKTDTKISLLKYLEAEKEQSKSKGMFPKMDELDSFAAYYQDETFPVAGAELTLFFSPHEWSSFYNEYLFEKHKDNIYELVEMQYPNIFNVIKHASDDTYNFVDTAFITGGRCIKYKNRLLWVMYPVGVNSSEIEVRTYTFIGEFFSYYLDKYKKNFFNLLNKYGFVTNEEEFVINLYPDSTIKRNSSLSYLAPFLSDLAEEEIIFISNHITAHHVLHVSIVYEASMEALINIFKVDSKKNPEKKVFKNFIHSIVDCLMIDDSELVAQSFIEKNWHLDKRAFVFDSRYVDNPRLEEYRDPKQIQDSFISMVNQDIVTYLKELNIEPKEYWNTDAKHLNNLIFEFLQEKLEQEISKLNSSVLSYAYTQIEYIEGQREKDESQAGMDSSKHIEFDIQEKFNKQRIETSRLAVLAKHILHTTLKVNPHGGKAVVDSDWYHIMSLSTIINETVQRSEQLHYSIVETGIEITDIYELIDIDRSSQIDFDGYFKKMTSSKIISAKNRLPQEQKLEKNDNPRKVKIFDVKLNDAWYEENKFYLDDMVVVLNTIGRYDFSRDAYFPLNFVSIEEMNSLIQEHVVEPPCKDEVERIVDYLSLGYGTFSDYKYIDYSIDRLMRKKERINLSPFVKIDDKYLFGNQLLLASTKAWFYPLMEGDVPFGINEESLVKAELKRIHRDLDLELENKAYEVAKDAIGENYAEKNILNFKRLSRNFPKQPPCGEIDLLVANPAKKTIFIMDAKNINKKLFNSAISRELRDFFHGRSKKKSYLEKLNLKVGFVKENLDEILTYFKIEDKSDWKIKKGFVVNTLYFSAYYEEKVDFILVDDLGEYLLSEISKNDKDVE